MLFSDIHNYNHFRHNTVSYFFFYNQLFFRNSSVQYSLSEKHINHLHIAKEPLKVIIAATTIKTTTIRKQTIKLHIVTVVLEFIVSVTRPGGWPVGGLKDPDATCEESASLTDALAGMWGNTRWVITYREHWSQVKTGPQATHDQKWSCLQLSDLWQRSSDD